MQTLNSESTEGATLALHTYRPGAGGTTVGAVVIGAATGVRQDYCRPFAEWLATQGYAVMTFDYRGMGDSRAPAQSLRGFEADLLSWVRDYDLVIDALLSVAAGSGYWRDNAPQLRCMDPRYLVGAEGATARAQFERVRFPIVALSITDAELMTERGTRVLVDCYANAPRRIGRGSPADVKGRRIGHFGFLRDQFQSSLGARSVALMQGFHLTQETAA